MRLRLRFLLVMFAFEFALPKSKTISIFWSEPVDSSMSMAPWLEVEEEQVQEEEEVSIVSSGNDGSISIVVGPVAEVIRVLEKQLRQRDVVDLRDLMMR